MGYGLFCVLGGDGGESGLWVNADPDFHQDDNSFRISLRLRFCVR